MNDSVNILRDERVDCFSVLTNIRIKDYLELVQTAYKSKGGIEGQRQALKTKSAIRIRQRMRNDIVKGTILPPIVIGIVLDKETYEKVDSMQSDKGAILDILNNVSKESLSIIDGMQRTTAIVDAMTDNKNLGDKEIRVEYWLSTNTNSLLYRMLILNSGQVPWNIRRQIEILYNSLINEIRSKVENIHLIEIDENGNRSAPGTFQADKIIELFLVFGARKYKIDTKEALADEFTKLDFIEATSDRDFSDIFFELLSRMCLFDEYIFNYKPEIDNSDDDDYTDDNSKVTGKFIKGKDLFGSHTARIGFMTAFSIEIFGLPGDERSVEEQHERCNKVLNKMDEFLAKIKDYDNDRLEAFLDFMTLNERINKVVSKVGDFEREFFTNAFRLLIKEEFTFTNLSPCWRS
ncbi:hypothetical protein HPT25_01700 [Bacillus sp. BRMEA1]|uniref:hypothetical protein n=1 Tax=Neobacillus endophyticus TaxID=2738405 RepID=UPI0015665338|nr:hypothetical protein [Neobacillus endophyticus]NRD76222.1 hypothetical protein [Neobacillus endophyticus]